MELRLGTPEEVGISPGRVGLIQERARGWVEDGHHPCLVLLGARRGVIFLHEAYGVLRPEENSPPVRLDTIFPLASLTKPFTAAVAMTLVEDGLLGLNRPVVDYIPEFHGKGRERVLIRHLMTHTSGIRDEDILELVKRDRPELDDQLANRWLWENLDQWIVLSSQVELHSPPDEAMLYADSNFELLGVVIERLTGTNMNEAARSRVFHKLGMKDTHYILPDDLSDRYVHRPGSAPFKDLERIWIKTSSGSGGLCSSAYDAAIFGQMFLNQGVYGESRVLSKASVRAITRNQIPGMTARVVGREFPNASWGLGWSITAPFKGPLYGEQMLSSRSFVHGGAGGVFLWVEPTLDIVGVYFSVTLSEEQRSYKGFADLFLNMVVASIEEA